MLPNSFYDENAAILRRFKLNKNLFSKVYIRGEKMTSSLDSQYNCPAMASYLTIGKAHLFIILNNELSPSFPCAMVMCIVYSCISLSFDVEYFMLFYTNNWAAVFSNLQLLRHPNKVSKTYGI